MNIQYNAFPFFWPSQYIGIQYTTKSSAEASELAEATMQVEVGFASQGVNVICSMVLEYLPTFGEFLVEM